MINKASLLLFALCIWIVHPSQANAQAQRPEQSSVQIIYAGQLMTSPGKKLVSNVSIVIENGVIRSIREGYIAPEDVHTNPEQAISIIDLKPYVILPGLIDSHVHLTSQLGPNAELEEVKRSVGDDTIDGVIYAKRTVEAGFTTVRDLSADPAAIFALRDAVRDGRIPGPRILAAGRMVSITGGHGDATGFRDGLIPSPNTVCDGAEACRKVVREQVKRGVDLIKIASGGGVFSNVGSGFSRQFTDEELSAIVDEAHNFGLKVAAHAHSAEAITAALRANVDSIEHGTFLTNEDIRLFREHRTYLVPTMLAGVTALEFARGDPSLPPAIRAKALLVDSAIKTFVNRAHRGGVRIAFGTDAGVARHGDNMQELSLMVAAGLTPVEALQAATTNAADLLGLSDRIGRVAPNMSADLIAVDADPSQNIEIMKNLRFVMASGRVVKAVKNAPSEK